MIRSVYAFCTSSFSGSECSGKASTILPVLLTDYIHHLSNTYVSIPLHITWLAEYRGFESHPEQLIEKCVVLGVVAMYLLCTIQYMKRLTSICLPPMISVLPSTSPDSSLNLYPVAFPILNVHTYIVMSKNSRP